MCGITGFFSEQVIDAKNFYNAHLSIRHRGPDDEGFVTLENGESRYYRGDDTVPAFGQLGHIASVASARLILGHRRLSIIDISERGHQPFCDETGRFHIVYNGEVYNYLELRDELEKLGHKFTSRSDTEVVLKAYIQWGSQCFNRFNGMWALAIYDSLEDKVVLSRDRFGVKPLFYSCQRGTLVFGSETKFIRAFQPTPQTLNKRVAVDYLERGLLGHSAGTFWEEIQELSPGHFLECRHGRIAVEKFWQYQPTTLPRAEDQIHEQFAALFADAVRLRMRSDVEVGTLLSGGLDSNLIVFELFRQGTLNDKQFQSFSAVFDEAEYDERKYIDQTLSRLPLKPHFIYPKPDNLLADLPKLLWHNEEPFRSLSVYSQYLIYKHINAVTKVKVVLNGQGADEQFGGYTYHYYPYFTELLRRGAIRKLVKDIAAFHENRGISYRYIMTSMLRRAWLMITQGWDFNQETFREITVSPLREYLRYDDRNSMAFGVEARAPFMDYRLIEFAFSLEYKYKIDSGSNKKIERDYATRLLPPEIIARKDKMGFVSPQESWQRKELSSELREISLRIKDTLETVGANIPEGYRKYTGYFNGDHNDWVGVWRMFCMHQWLKINGMGGEI